MNDDPTTYSSPSEAFMHSSFVPWPRKPLSSKKGQSSLKHVKTPGRQAAKSLRRQKRNV